MVSNEHFLTGADALTLRMERDPLLRSTIVAVAEFDRSPDWDHLVARLERATRLYPNFRRKVAAPAFGITPPRWVTDPDFDMSFHLRRVSVAPGRGFGGVVEFARKTGMTAFDADRPLWLFTLVEGLPDGRAAMVLKVHHALTDGVGGIQMAMHIVDLERELPDLAPMPPLPDPTPTGFLADVRDVIDFEAQLAGDAGRELVSRGPALVRDGLRDPVRQVSGLVDTVSSLGRLLRPVTTTRSPLMRDRRLQWYYHWLQVPFDRLRAAARSVEGTLNDAFLAAVAGGFRRYHDRHGVMVNELRVTMPINLRTEGDRQGGNRITLMRFDIPVGRDDPAQRMREMGEVARRQRREPSIAFTEQVAVLLNNVPVQAVGGMMKHIDLVASNVPGFPGEVYVAGSRVESFYAFGPTTGASANVTLMSYRGVCHVGITTDNGAIAEPDVLRDCLQEAFEEIMAVGA